MTNKIFTPESSPEDMKELCQQIKDVAHLLNNNPQAAKLLEDAQAGRISEAQLLTGLAKL